MKGAELSGAAIMPALILRRLFLCCNQIQQIQKTATILQSPKISFLFLQPKKMDFSEPIGLNYFLPLPTTSFSKREKIKLETD